MKVNSRAKKPGYMKLSLKERLLTKKIIKENGCWEFNGWLNNQGYGMLRYEGKLWLAHRLSFKLFKPEEYNEYLCILHNCDNTKCFNPEHLKIGTLSDNMQDMFNRGRESTAPNFNSFKTHCPSGHEYTPENTRYSKKGGRKCVKCQNIYNAMRMFKQ